MTCLTQKSTQLDSKKLKRAQNETCLFLYDDFIVHDFKNKKPKLVKNSCADEIVCMFKLVPFSYKSLARNDRHSVEKL